MSRIKAKRQSQKRKRRGAHREKRIKASESDLAFIDYDAPLGTYLIDPVAQEIFKHTQSAIKDEFEFVKTIREKITLAAMYALMRATYYINRAPLKRHLAKRFCNDLDEIHGRIERNKNLDALDVYFFTRSRRHKSGLQAPPGMIRELQAALQHTNNLIHKFLALSVPAGHPGNHDWLTQVFIRELSELWVDYLWAEALPNESRFFVQFLAAAWHDVGLPINDENGRSLEDWLADRVRKQFTEDIAAIRTRHQSEEMYEAYLRDRPTVLTRNLRDEDFEANSVDS